MTTNYCIRRHIFRQVGLRVDNAIIPDSDAGHNTNLDASAAVISDEGSQFITAGIDQFIADFYLDRFGIEPPVRSNRTGAERTMFPDDRITGVTYMELCLVAYIRFLDFLRETDHRDANNS